MSKASDATITPQDVLEAMLNLRKEGIGQAAQRLMEREPALGDLVAGRWNNVQAILRDLGLSDEQSRPVLVEVCRVIMESWVAMDRSHRRMWDDLMPADTEGGDDAGGR